MRSYRTISSVIILFLIWQFLALWMRNDWIMPYPKAVMQLMLSQLMDPVFYQSIMTTLLRSCIGLSIAFLIAFLCAYASYERRLFRDLFYPVLLLTRSIPNISFIILVLVWFGSEKSSAIVSFLILFPTIYSSIYFGFTHIDLKLKHVLQLYPKKRSYLLYKIYLPLLEGPLRASLSNGLSLAFKIGVMAEIVGQVQVGIGRQLNLCRLQSNMTGIFAWTGWIILILLILEGLVQLLSHHKRLKSLSSNYC